MSLTLSYPYQIGGSLRSNNPYYVTREADAQFLRALRQGNFCSVLAPRQMGKSSLLVKTRANLEGMGHYCASIDMTSIGSDNITPQQWYKGLIYDLHRGFHLTRRCNLKNWFLEHDHLAPVQQLNQFLEELILNFFPTQNLFIFVDEIDSVLSLDFSVDDFFALIRYFYNQRATNSAFNRITFTILGVATPSSLIQDRQRTPFNIGVFIQLKGFSLAESAPLAAGLKAKWPHLYLPLLTEILAWTNGQPFLTQKLCQLVIENLALNQSYLDYQKDLVCRHVSQIVHEHLIDNWEVSDRPEHLRTIVNRLLHHEERAAKLLGIYQTILREGKIHSENSAEQDELLLSGLVVQKDAYLTVANPIYQAVFNLNWAQHKLNTLRPYSQALNAWRKSHCSDASRLLRGQALRDAQLWSRGKHLDPVDYQFLTASEELDRLESEQKLESERRKAIEIQLQAERKNARLQTLLLTLLSAALLLVSGFGAFAFWQYRRAKISETRALIASSQGLYASDDQIGAMAAALKARLSISRLQWLGYRDQDLRAQVSLALGQTVFNNNEINRLMGHQGSVLSVAVSPDDKLIATASNDKTVKLWGADGALLSTLPHTSTVHRVAFAPDSRRLVTGTLDGRVWIWQTNGQLLQRIQAHSAPVWGVAFSPEGTEVASASGDGTAKIWSLAGRWLQTLRGHSADVWAVAFSPNGGQIATASMDQSLVLWSRSGRFLRRLNGHQGPVWDLDFCSEQILTSVSSDHTVKLWQTEGRLQRVFRDDHTLLGVSCRGGFVAASGKNNLVKIWEEDGTFRRSLPGHGALIRDVAFSSDGNQLVSGSDDGAAKVWRRNQLFVRPLYEGQDTLWAVAASPDGKFFAATSGRWINLYDHQGNLRHRLSANKYTTHHVLFSADSRSLITANNEGNSFLWNLNHLGAGDNPPTQFLAAPKGVKLGGALSPDGETLAVGGDFQEIWLTDLKTKAVTRIANLPDRIWALSFSADGQTLVSASEDGAAKLWNRQGKPLATLNHGGAVWGAAISPKESLVATASRAGTWKLWDFQGNLLKTVPGQSNGLTRVAFSPDGQTLATGGIDNTIKLWNLEGELLNTLSGHRGSVVSVTFSPDGKFLLSGGDEGVAMLWDLAKIQTTDAGHYACEWLQDYLRHSEDRTSDESRVCPP